ncbi:MAG TPA: hemerythrin domain-containing protein [Streptosporangiaceae bacterium]|nr:hemerythrin domain-containing protein [Streptosporangiaceae bacterium]
MCEHCGCREITPIGRLMAEHERLLDLVGLIRTALRAGDESGAREIVAELAGVLDPHVRAERGLFAVMREQGEFVDYLDGLEGEHADLAARLAGPLAAADLIEICDRLREHIQAEEYGLFPAALAGLGGGDWDDVTAREAVASS